MSRPEYFLGLHIEQRRTFRCSEVFVSEWLGDYATEEERTVGPDWLQKKADLIRHARAVRIGKWDGPVDPHEFTDEPAHYLVADLTTDWLVINVCRCGAAFACHPDDGDDATGQYSTWAHLQVLGHGERL
jgi:hypothetical protein